MISPKEIISELMAAAQKYHEEDGGGNAVVAFNPQEEIVEPGIFLEAPEHFVTLPIRDGNSPQYSLQEARSILYPQIKSKVIQ